MRRWSSLVAALALLASCAGGGASGKPLVLTTTTIFADLARVVGGDRVEVQSIVPAGAHVEEYEPRPDDGRRVSRARLIVVNGLDLDAWASALLRDKRADAEVVTLAEGLPAIGDNPHLWFDVSLARRYVEKIRDALAAADPAGAATFAENARRYDEQLSALDAALRSTIASIPPERRKLVTSHDAYPYFAKAYGLEVVGFAQVEPGKDPSPAELAALVQAIRAANVPAVFSEAGVSPAIADTIARETGVRIVTDLPTDSLGPPPTDSYVGLMRALATRIAEALR